MQLIVNGEKREVKDNITVNELLNDLKIKDKTMAVAVDMQIVKKEDWEKKVLQNGQKVEFLQFVGGG